MHGVINSLLVVASIVKVVYSTVVIVARKYDLCRNLFCFSSYD